MSIVARLDLEPFSPGEELAAITSAAAGAGAIVSFVGLARERSASGEPIDRLILDHHPKLTERSMEEIAAAARARFGVSHVHVVHRRGEMRPGEPIVFAAAAAPHRRAAFEAADYLMDRLKTEAVFWKREEGPSGTNWIEPTDADYGDRERWE